ncbi:MAG TPA: hypothetical protein PKC69_13780 [Chitinophagaceae bacterium]|nr:hypothetical protein [Chitinophagaceae bacterium]
MPKRFAAAVGVGGVLCEIESHQQHSGERNVALPPVHPPAFPVLPGIGSCGALLFCLLVYLRIG